MLLASCAMPAAAKEYRKPPATRIDWPLPWATGASLDYDQSNEHVLEYRGVGTHTTRRRITRISTVGRAGNGFVQGWTTLAVFERELTPSQSSPHTTPQASWEADPAMAQVIEDAFGKMTLQVKLAQDGTYAGIENLLPLQARLQQLIDEMAVRSGPDRQAAQLPAAERMAMHDRLLIAYSRRPLLEAELSLLPIAYNFASGGGVGLDYEYVYEDLTANPLGGDPFPMTVRMTLRRDELREDWLLMEWSTALDRVRGGPILAAMVGQLLGPPPLQRSTKQDSDALAHAAEDLDFGTSTRFRIDPATGIVQWMQTVQRRRIGDCNDVRATTLSLRSEPYVPAVSSDRAAGAGL